MIKKVSAFILLTLSFNHSFAQNPIAPGDYVTKGHWGQLEIIDVSKNNFKFWISTVRPNSSLCNVNGTAVNGVARLKDEPSAPECIINFKAKGNSVVVEGNEVCEAQYCGANAFIDGEYLKLLPQCDNAGITKSRIKFTRLYKEKKYDEALSILKPTLNICEKTLSTTDDGWIRNDLAVAYAKLNRLEDCSKILEPLKEDGEMSDEELRKNHGIFYVDNNIKMIKATRTNLKLCKVK